MELNVSALYERASEPPVRTECEFIFTCKLIIHCFKIK